MRPIALLCLVLAITACTPRGTMVVVPPETAEGPISTVFVGTTRGLEGTGVFGSGRSEEMRFARYDVAIQPQRAVGEIKYAKPRNANVSTDFLTTDQRLSLIHI